MHPKVHTVFPHIVFTHLCTVTFGFPRNSLRSNYIRKYGIMNKEFPAFLTKVASFPNETRVVVLYDHLGLTIPASNS